MSHGPQRLPEDKEIIQRVAVNTRRLRNKLGLSQLALAERARMRKNYVSLIECGGVSISVAYLGRLAKALCTEPENLVAPL